MNEPEELSGQSVGRPPVPASSLPQAIERKQASPSRPALWALLGVIVGFALPVLSCAALLLAGLVGAGIAGRGTTVASTPGSGPAVAIVRVEGVMQASDSPRFSIGATSGAVIADLKRAAADPEVKAIVLRVDSPGGTVTAAAQIHSAIEGLEKPVVASMASVAASGGYYISAPADYIFARPDTLTGSLGARMTIITAEAFLTDLGIKMEDITSGPNKAMGSLGQELTEEQRAILQGFVDEGYDQFVQVIASGRGLSEERVRHLADGRIYSGRQALELDLVDELGDLDQAVAKAAELGGISGEPRRLEFEHAPTLSDFLADFSLKLSQSRADELLQSFYDLASPRLEYLYLEPGS